jgi:hypothetical protein
MPYNCHQHLIIGGNVKYLPWVLSAICMALLGFVWHDSQLKIEQKDAELASIKQQYDQLVADANSKLEAAHTKAQQIADAANARLTEQANDANEKLQQANQREVQVSVRFRKAMLSNGHVAVISNTSGQTIAISVDIQRSSSGQGRSVDLTIDPGRFKELGEREGWAFVSGDSIKVNQPGCKSLTYTF